MRPPATLRAILCLVPFLAGCPTQENPLGPPVGPPASTVPALALQIGGLGDDLVRAVAVDAGGNTFVAGQFSGTVDFDPSATTQALTSLGGQDVFLARYSSAGALAWVARLGGVLEDSVSALALDAAGNLYVGGSFAGTADFDPGSGTLALTSNGGRDAWVASYSSSGTVRWARGAGGTADEALLDLTSAPSGAVYAAGQFSGTMLVDAGQAISLTSVGQSDGFLASWTGSGVIRWAVGLGGPGNDAASAVAAGAAGALFVAGSFQGTADLAPGTPVATVTAMGGFDGFLARYDESGTLAWARGFGGSMDDAVAPGGLSARTDGTTWVTGGFRGTADFDGSSAITARTSYGESDIFLLQHDAGGNLAWAVTAGGPGEDAGADLVATAGGTVALTGSFQETARFDPGLSATSLTGLGSGGASNLFVAQYGGGGGFLWAVGIGAPVSGAGFRTRGTGVAIDGGGNVLVAGGFYGTPDVDPGSGITTLTNLGQSDGLLVQYTAAGALARRP